jgi:hypothetical protein
MQHLSNKSLIRRSVLAAAVLAGFLMFTAVPLLRADEHDCQRRVARADHHLDQAVARHGVHSRQAEVARRQLREEREHCWNGVHRWWDEHEQRWHTERDWDDHDHDRDRH